MRYETRDMSQTRTIALNTSLPIAEGKVCSALFIVTGFMPVSAIVLHCTGILPLNLALGLLIFPFLLLLLSAGVYNRPIGRIAMRGWVAGLIAVFIYDLSRLPYMYFGWGDFIPRIGGWLTGTGEPDAVIGYAWRYIGNGGGMGMAFFVLASLMGWNKPMIGKGIAFGLFVFSCLMVTLLIFPEAQKMMFKITPLAFAGSLTGHIVYGAVLGWMYKKLTGWIS